PRTPSWLATRLVGDALDLALVGTGLLAVGGRRKRTVAAGLGVLGVTALGAIAWERLTESRTAPGPDAAGDGMRHVRRTITVGRPPEVCYDLWRRLENLPRFMRHLESVEVTGESRSHWRARGPGGVTVEWDAEIVEARPHE